MNFVQFQEQDKPQNLARDKVCIHTKYITVYQMLLHVQIEVFFSQVFFQNSKST